ncbi:hypothetical protein BJX68DRAFT_244634 [Aspergillus pseudodeflectus]|uniref:F-box domain-containing protein n=1 Tax=Aspergillus pseudodeflectus TaxID=176178 RepID=A0ABR4JRJ0_9EURO
MEVQTQPPFLAIMAIHECVEVVLGCLPRSDLKNLRLACKAADEVVTSSVSPLFRRVYISAFRHDLEALREIARHPRLSRCVRELVWDTSMHPNMYPHRESYYYETYYQQQASEYIVAGFTDALTQGKDFELLVEALPCFPRLQGVTFTVLMSHWIPRSHSPNTASHPRFDFRTELALVDGVTQYSSPAMRAWEERGIDYVLKHHNIPLGYPRQIPDDDVLTSLEEMAAGLPTAERVDFAELATYTHRAPILMLAALRALKIRLTSFVIDLPFLRARHRNVSTSWFRGLNLLILGFPTIPLASIWFFDMFRSLRRLRLGLDDTAGCRESIARAFAGATSLEVLEVVLYRQGWLDLNNLLPPLRLKRLVLQNFDVGRGDWENVLMPWCFGNRLETLHLARCRFLRPEGVGKTEIFAALLARDTSCPPRDVLYSNFDRELGYRVDSDSSSNSDAEDEAEDEHGTCFLDIDFNSDSSSESDPDFFPSTEEMLSRHADAPFYDDAAGDFAEEMAYVYWQYYHSEGPDEFTEPIDTVPIEDEIPMARLRADAARMIDDEVSDENVELVYEAWVWGCEGGGKLRVWIDGFKVHSKRYEV